MITSVAERKVPVLVADHEAHIRELLRAYLIPERFDVIEAADGADAVQKAIEHQPDVAILEATLPTISGFDVCRALKSDPQAKKIIILLMTSRMRPADLIEGLRAGTDDYLPKPFTRNGVVLKVKKAALARREGSKLVKIPERREPRVKVSGATVMFETPEGGQFSEPLLDLSIKGFAFEHRRCATCTGYDKGAVHPLCALAPWARRFKESDALTFLLWLSPNVVVRTDGKIAHIFQPDDAPQTERVGVAFTAVTEDAMTEIKNFLSAIRPLKSP